MIKEDEPIENSEVKEYSFFKLSFEKVCMKDTGILFRDIELRSDVANLRFTKAIAGDMYR